MTKTAMVRARIEPDVKEQAEETLAELGVSPTAAIAMFYRQIIHRGGIPFEVAMPKTATPAPKRRSENSR